MESLIAERVGCDRVYAPLQDRWCNAEFGCNNKFPMLVNMCENGLEMGLGLMEPFLFPMEAGAWCVVVC